MDSIASRALHRREFLSTAYCGFGGLAAAALEASVARGAGASPLRARAPHFEPPAKSVIFLFMSGGPSHVDTFDYKPRLATDAGKPAPRGRGRLLGSPFAFAQHGQSGLWVSELFSNVARHADRLCVDPVMRQVVGGRATEKQAASTSQMAHFETAVLTRPDNLKALMDLSGKWIEQVQQRRPTDRIILDLDSSVSETHGQQEGSAYNGYFECTCYHPLFCFNQDGDLERALLRNGNVSSADDWRSVLETVVARYRHRPLGFKRFFRGDAGFAKPEVYGFLEIEGYHYAIRLPANDVLHREIQHLMTRPVGRPPVKPIVLYHDFPYRAATWDKARRVVAKVEWHKDELFPRVGFIVTNMGGGAAPVTWFYNGRGTAEQ